MVMTTATAAEAAGGVGAEAETVREVENVIHIEMIVEMDHIEMKEIIEIEMENNKEGEIANDAAVAVVVVTEVEVKEDHHHHRHLLLLSSWMSLKSTQFTEAE